jgi:hypothetical protein
MLELMPPLPGNALPTDTFFGDEKTIFFNNEPIIMHHQPKAHTDGDITVFFRRSDVIVTGDVYINSVFPIFMPAQGGSYQGIIDALNNIIDYAVPKEKEEGGTYIIPGHGRVGDEFDVVDARDMEHDHPRSVPGRDQEGPDARAGEGRQSRSATTRSLGRERGFWTTNSFVEAVYNSLKTPAGADGAVTAVHASDCVAPRRGVMVVESERGPVSWPANQSSSWRRGNEPEDCSGTRRRGRRRCCHRHRTGVGRRQRGGPGTAARAAAPAAPAGGRAGAPPAGQGRGGGAPAAPLTAQAAPAIDLTGNWVSVVNEDWRWRMVTPPKGDSPACRSTQKAPAGDTWTPAMDGQCQAYGMAGLMRQPTRLRISWQDPQTLKIETDAGVQTRLLRFRSGSAETHHTLLAGLQRGHLGALGWWWSSRWRWPAPSGGDLKAVTTMLTPGWLRKNGAPTVQDATVTEYFDRFTAPNGDEWFSVTTVVDDPKYLNQAFVTSSHFKKEPDGSKWSPSPCRVSS